MRLRRSEVSPPCGSPEDPVGEDEIAAKFMACAEGVISAAAASTAVEVIGRMEGLGSLVPLTAPLCRPALAGAYRPI